VATAQVIADEISRIGGIPSSTVRTIARRLGEASLLPRGGRGKPPQKLSARDCARLIIGTMRIADGINVAVARVDQLVHDVERLKCQGNVSTVEVPRIAVVEPGSFVGQLASLIKRLSTDEKTRLRQLVAAVGLTTGPDRLWGWLEFRRDWERLDVEGTELIPSYGSSRVIFGRGHFDNSGLTREIRITSEALCEIAAAWRLGESLTEEGHVFWGGPQRG
jgi:hypothetical protein